MYSGGAWRYSRGAISGSPEWHRGTPEWHSDTPKGNGGTPEVLRCTPEVYGCTPDGTGVFQRLMGVSLYCALDQIPTYRCSSPYNVTINMFSLAKYSYYYIDIHIARLDGTRAATELL